MSKSEIKLIGPGPFVLGVADTVELKSNAARSHFGFVFQAKSPDTGADVSIEVALPQEQAMALLALLQSEQQENNLPIPPISVDRKTVQ